MEAQPFSILFLAGPWGRLVTVWDPWPQQKAQEEKQLVSGLYFRVLSGWGFGSGHSRVLK